MREKSSATSVPSTPSGAAGSASDEELRRFRAAMDASPDCVLITDVETARFIYVNDTVCRLTDYQPEELQRLRPWHLSGSRHEDWLALLERVRARGVDGLVGPPHIGVSRRGDRKGWWEPHHRALELDGRWLLITVSREVTSRMLAEEAALRAKRLYATLSATNEIIMRARSPEELFQQVCEAAVDSGGIASVSILLTEPGTPELRCVGVAGAGHQRMRHGRLAAGSRGAAGSSLAASALATGESAISNDFLNDPRTSPWHDLAMQIELKSAAAIPIRRQDAVVGVLFLCAADKRAFDEEVVALLERMTENLAFALQNFEHEAERARAEDRIRFLASHDDLTGLPKRSLFRDLLDAAIRSAHRYHRGLAVMFLDLDRFKTINDTLGHAAGDRLLVVVTERLRHALRDSDVLARHSGDEFLVLLNEVSRQADAATIARKLLAAAAEPVEINGRTCQISTSIGISLYPADGRDEATLMKHADIAMYRSKQLGKNTFAFHEPDASGGDPQAPAGGADPPERPPA